MIDGTTYQDSTSSGNNGYDWLTSYSGGNYPDILMLAGERKKRLLARKPYLGREKVNNVRDLPTALFSATLRKRAWRRQK